MIMRKLIDPFLLFFLAAALVITGCATPAEAVEEPASVQSSSPALITPLMRARPRKTPAPASETISETVAEDIEAKTGDGTSANPYAIKITGVELTDETLTEIYSAIASIIPDGEISLDLSAGTGSRIGYQGTARMVPESLDRIVSLILPASVTALEPDASGIGAFEGYTRLKTVVAPGLTRIGDRAFLGCTDLASVNFPSVTSVGEGAFYGCTSLIAVSLPAVTSLGNRAFSGCTSLTAVTLSKARTLGDWTFSGCTGLVSAVLPAVTSVGSEVFSGCNSLKTVRMPKAPPGSY
ncbi:hypothetical protein FACS189476_02250 [Spirochaetia bacterium]|nr:hypothetical protein FACS189476_02250 [Spirochaetia bacterium]